MFQSYTKKSPFKYDYYVFYFISSFVLLCDLLKSPDAGSKIFPTLWFYSQ